MRVRHAILAALLLPCAALAQYKWVEPDGHVAYGDQPPHDARKVVRIDAASGPAVGPDALASLPFELRRVAQSFPVTLYTMTAQDCAPCASGRSFLRARGVPFQERTVNTERDQAALQALGGNGLLPALNVGRSFLRAFDPGPWQQALDDAGYPARSLLPAAWQWPAASPLAPLPPTDEAAAGPGGAPAGN
jgi:hypothetical protein